MIEDATVPDFDSFSTLAAPGRIVPVRVELSFDTDTAVTAYAKLRTPPFGFLLESVEGGERWARYSFLGSEPREAWRLDGDEISRWTPAGGWRPTGPTHDPFTDFERWIREHRPVPVPGLPPFWGGAVGYFGYDTVRWLERLSDPPPRDLEVPDACFLATDRTLIIDNLRSRATAVKAVAIPPCESSEDSERLGEDVLRALYEEAVEALRGWVSRLSTGATLEPLVLTASELSPKRNRTREDFEQAVERVREYIGAGDAYQVVVSQRTETEMSVEPLDAYRALRMLNPSPYLFFLELDGVRLIGSSPESLVRVQDRRVTVRPIAGTRPRGRTPEQDEALAAELLADEKERAEHLMLVDLGRNDVGRVVEPGSVRVSEFMSIEKYSHVMHMVSEVTGRLAHPATAMEAFKACFPAGTLSGAPKVRAMEIIDELEPTRRGPYGGAAGYVAYGGDSLDMAIIIRTLLNLDRRAFAQAGAGIVHDSDPGREWQETCDKARVLMRALGAIDSS